MGAFSSLATAGLNLALQQRARDAEGKRAAKDRDRQLRQIAAEDALARQERDATLRRRVAEQRARAGASGVGDTGGSIDAVVRGLTAESSAAAAKDGLRLAERLGSIRESFAARRRRNLLETNRSWLDLGRAALGEPRSRRSLLD